MMTDMHQVLQNGGDFDESGKMLNVYSLSDPDSSLNFYFTPDPKKFITAEENNDWRLKKTNMIVKVWDLEKFQVIRKFNVKNFDEDKSGNRAYMFSQSADGHFIIAGKNKIVLLFSS